MNRLINSSGLDKLREKEARQYPLYNPSSRKWVVHVCQSFEVSAIRQNNQHGFISIGWGDLDEKHILGDLQECYSKAERKIRLKYLKDMAQVIADALNKRDSKYKSKVKSNVRR